MLLDGELVLSNAQAFTSTGDLASTNRIDMTIGEDWEGNARAKNPGEGGDLFLHIRVHTAFTSASPATAALTIALQECATSAGSYVTIMTVLSGYTAGQLTEGLEIWRGALPADAENLRYQALLYTTAGAVWTAGALQAHVSMDQSGIKAI